VVGLCDRCGKNPKSDKIRNVSIDRGKYQGVASLEVCVACWEQTRPVERPKKPNQKEAKRTIKAAIKKLKKQQESENA